MKPTWMMLAIGLIFSASPASAADMKLDLNIPEVSVEGLQGNSNAVSLWVEDARKETVLGKNLQGENVVLKGDAAAAVMASFSSTLRTAGFKVDPYRADAPVSMLIRIQSLTYDSEKNFMTSTANLSCKFMAILSHGGVMKKERTLGTSGEFTLPWRPNKDRVAELVSEILHDNVLAVLQDDDTAAFLTTSP